MLAAVLGAVTDPSTLVLELVLAAGALVAILGGFLISRVVGLLTQKETLQMRRRELIGRTELGRRRLVHVHEERLAVSWEVIRRPSLDIVEANGDVDAEAIVDDSDYRGTTREEMSELAEKRVRQVKTAFAQFKISNRGRRGTRSSQVSLVMKEKVWSLVARKLAERTQPAFLRLTSPTIRASMVVGDLPFQRQDQRIRDEEMLQANLMALEGELDLVNHELVALGAGSPRCW